MGLCGSLPACQYLCIYVCLCSNCCQRLVQLEYLHAFMWSCLRTTSPFVNMCVCVRACNAQSVLKRGRAAVMRWHLSFAAVPWSGAEGRGQATLTETLQFRAHHVCLPRGAARKHKHARILAHNDHKTLICIHTSTDVCLFKLHKSFRFSINCSSLTFNTPPKNSTMITYYLIIKNNFFLSSLWACSMQA